MNSFFTSDMSSERGEMAQEGLDKRLDKRRFGLFRDMEEVNCMSDLVLIET